jgi:hypothetical protein
VAIAIDWHNAIVAAASAGPTFVTGASHWLASIFAYEPYSPAIQNCQLLAGATSSLIRLSGDAI